MGDEWKKAFKEAFRLKEAEEAAAAASGKLAEQAKVQAEKEAAAAKLAEQNAKNKLGLAEKPKKPDAAKVATLKGEYETAQQLHQQAKDKVQAEDDRVRDFAQKEQAARAEKEEIARAEKRGEYSQTIKVYKRRLAAAGLSAALDEHFKILQPLYIEDDFEGLKKALAKADDALLAAVATHETASTQADREKRVAALRRKPFESNQDLKTLTLQLNETARLVQDGRLVEALTALERKVTPLLAACETEADAYEALAADIDQRLKDLAANDFRHQESLEAVEAARKKAVQTARSGSFVDAGALLGAADAKLIEAEERAEENASDAQSYPGLLAQVEQEVKDFISANKGFKLECDKKAGQWIRAAAYQATAPAGSKDFSAAVMQLGEASAVIDGLYAKAQAVQDKLNQKAQDAAELLAQQNAKKVAAQKAAAAKLAAETALAPSSLTAIGKNNIDKWIVQLGKLLQGPAPVCSISGGSTTFWLPGNTTVEAICRVTAVSNGAFVDTFVVHYHPTARFSDPGGSPLHAKPKRGNATTPHHYMQDHHWLVADGHVPSHATVKSQYL